jgi:hypothetical protein
MARARSVLDDLRLTHKILQRLKIPHALIGGWATVAWGAVRATYVCREDLIAMKLAAGGGLDFHDVQAILSIHGKTMDRQLLENSCRRLRVDRILKKIWEKL